MSAFREHVPLAFDLQMEHERRAPSSDMDEMRALAGASVDEAWGDLPATGPVGPRLLQPAPRAPAGPSQIGLRPSPRENGQPPSVVANDPTRGDKYALGARRARRMYTQQWQTEDNRAILADPRVVQSLRQINRLVGDIDHTLRQKQGTLESLRLHIAHLLGTSVRHGDGATQLRSHLPNLLELLDDIAAGNPAAEYREKVATVMAELDSAGASAEEPQQAQPQNPFDGFLGF